MFGWLGEVGRRGTNKFKVYFLQLDEQLNTLCGMLEIAKIDFATSMNI